jgi:hypothetical protein
MILDTDFSLNLLHIGYVQTNAEVQHLLVRIY